jgi:hypothetical protein
VSGKDNLLFRGNVDLSASNGSLGTLLLDPENITIANTTNTDTQNYTISNTDLQGQAAAVLLEAAKDITIEASLDFVSGGSITFTADADGQNGGSFVINEDTSLNTNGRPLTIIAAAVELNGTINTGSGDVTFQPSTTSSTIGIGDGATGVFNLDTNELTTKLDTGGTVTIGRSDGDGAINIDSANASLDLSGKSFNLGLQGGDVIFKNNITSSGNLTVTANNTITNNGKINASAGGNISLTANEINLGNTVSGTGNLLLQPFNPERSLLVVAETLLSV